MWVNTGAVWGTGKPAEGAEARTAGESPTRRRRPPKQGNAHLYIAARCVRVPENPVWGAGSKMCFCKQKPPRQGGAAPVASPGKCRFSVDNRLSVLCLPRPRGQTGSVAIYSLHLRSIGKTTHAPRTAGAHLRYITRPEARATLLAGRMPIERHAARRWLDREERRDRQNARVIDKLTVALPRELDPQQRRGLVMAFAERVTQGRAAWFAAIHQSGRDAHNPHAHIVIRDRDPETGKRVALLSEKGACRNIRLLWELAVNAVLEAQGTPQRVTRLSHAARGIETPPQRHRGPQRLQEGRETDWPGA
ncbi:hypothetical protein E4P82_20750, partial [Candidatus Competibacter phosphatis]|nr:hypothetical protein [Candidatus Competibacter phosphatis]